jgi:hypothetical protein
MGKTDWYKKGYEEGKKNKEYIKRCSENFLKQFQAGMGNISAERVKNYFSTLYKRRLDASPSLVKYPEVKGVRERIISQDKGLMDALHIDFGLLSIYRNYRFYFNYIENHGEKYKGKDCTIVYFSEGKDGPMVGKNVDDTKKFMYKKIPEFKIENRKFFVDCVSSGIFYGEVPPEIFPVPVFELLEENCSTLNEAIEFLSRYKFFWGQGSCILIEMKTKQGVVFEKSNCRYEIRKMKYGALWCTAMTFAEKRMKGYLDRKRRERVRRRREKWDESIEAEYWTGCDRRYKNLEKLIKERKGRFSLESMIEILHNRSPYPEGICLDGEGRTDDEFPETNYTILTRIWLMNKYKAGFWLFSDKNFACEARPVWKKAGG